jgi:hypothetical protein
MKKIAAIAAFVGISASHAAPLDAPGPRLMPEGQSVWLAGRITVGRNKYASGYYTQIELLQPETSPCDHKTVRQMLIWNMDVGDHMQLASYANELVVVRGLINCPNSGIQFAPEPNKITTVY